MESKQTQVKFRHVGSFSLLLLLSVFQPRSIWQEFSIPFVPLVLVVLGLILIYKVWLTIGIKGVWQKYRVELGLFAAYEVICFISLFLNRDLYPTTTDFIRWGLTFPIFQMSIPMAALLFVLPQNERGASLTQLLKNKKINTAMPLVILVITFCGMAIWQHIDYASSWEIFRFSIADSFNPALGDIRAFLERNPQISIVSSFFSINTDLGAIAAVVAIFLLTFAVTNTNKVAALSLFILVFCTGILSEGRVFLVGIGAGLLALLAVTFRNHKLLAVNTLIATILFAHVLMLFVSNHYIDKLGQFFPYLVKLYSNAPIAMSDFVPNFSLESFGDRRPIWILAVDQVAENPLLGISNGGFRLTGESLGGWALNNTHNVYLQLIIDGGIIGAVFISILLFRLTRRLTAFGFLILLTTAATLFVDNFSDHSLSWVIIVVYLISSSSTQMSLVRLNYDSSILSRLHIIFLTLSSFFLFVLFSWYA